MTSPLNIAHRGASAAEPENTMRAFETAVEAGADGIELDVYLSADGHAVVTHDLFTYRLTGVQSNVRKTTLKDLRTFDYGKGEKIPTLDDVLGTFKDKFKVINIEIKSTSFRSDGIEKTVADLIKRHDCAETILVSSFNPLNIQRVRKLVPKTRIGYLVDKHLQVPQFQSRTIKWLKPDTLNLHPALIRDKRTAFLFEMGIPFWIWSVDTAADWLFWIDKGAAALITDHPKRLHNLLHAEGRMAAIRS
jgi:glycerophosphoryl diester phosphodiesterase